MPSALATGIKKGFGDVCAIWFKKMSRLKFMTAKIETKKSGSSWEPQKMETKLNPN
jgi:hypothetical protein